jgi:AcrR family transcriptional regulator
MSKKMATASRATPHHDAGSQPTARERILEAAFAAFKEHGYASTSTLEIATRARVSKRALYALVGNKQQMLAACITERAGRLPLPADLPVPRDRETFEQVLRSFGAQLLREISDPTVIGVFRLAIAEAVHAPEVAQTLDSIGRETTRAALRDIMAQAQASGVLDGRPAELVEHFNGLLSGNLMVDLLLGVGKRPSAGEIAERARDAAAAFVQLHSPPRDDSKNCRPPARR